MSDVPEVQGTFAEHVKEHQVEEACVIMSNAVRFAGSHKEREVIGALIGDSIDVESVTAAATRLSEFATSLADAKQNALVALDRPWKLMAPNRYPVMLAEVSLL
jgi:hypothetical protein